jgi:hypothetical protein
MKSLLQAAAVAALAVAFGTGCQSQPGPGSSQDAAATGDLSTHQRIDAAGFLATGYEPLERWMDERFKVRYENMPLNMVFDQQPIADIRYQLEGLPPSGPAFHLISSSISRREILKEVADFFSLDMAVEMSNGQPSHVVVRPRGSAATLPPATYPAQVPPPAPASSGLGATYTASPTVPSPPGMLP